MKMFCRVEKLRYWKPVQTGFPPDDDTDMVSQLAGLAAGQVLPCAYRFTEPLSPHRAAELAQASIDPDRLIREFERASAGGPLLLEGAGGLAVPLTRQLTWLNFLERTRPNVLLVARTGLGTINHTLLSVMALREIGIEPAGILFCGAANADNVATIAEFSSVPILGGFLYEPAKGLAQLQWHTAARVLRLRSLL